jgi:rRNA maturation RNase YbeY
MGKITFFSEGIRFRPPNTVALRKGIFSFFESEGKSAGEINYIFCNDDYLLEMNRIYLQHDTLTDIITFDLTEEGEVNLCADIFISVERVRENADKLGFAFETELQRVMIHGVLHLLGYDDKTTDEQKTMRQKEEKFLNRLIPKTL